ncbi:hypothetical protein [Lysinibacillus sp. NPDC086135]|uniref:hypothetical protein n=1 Tax=Lysinibacillus sp. NPDC086135 TaxID=3364130 RepID=UPI00380785B3
MTTRETKQQKFGKEAFVNAAENNKDQFILQVVLEDGKSYTREEAAKLVKAWKDKEVKQ